MKSREKKMTANVLLQSLVLTPSTLAYIDSFGTSQAQCLPLHEFQLEETYLGLRRCRTSLNPTCMSLSDIYMCSVICSFLTARFVEVSLDKILITSWDLGLGPTTSERSRPLSLGV